MILADLIAGKHAPASVAEVAGIAVAKPAEQHPVDSGSVAKIAGIAAPTPENTGDEPLSKAETVGGATAIDAIPATGSHETLRAALSEAGAGLPVTVAELLREFGAEGREGWEAGDYAHPAFLRAFAVAVSERLEREQQRQAQDPKQLAEPAMTRSCRSLPTGQIDDRTVKRHNATKRRREPP